MADSQGTVQPTHRRHMFAVFEGASTPLVGFVYMWNHKDLWRYAVWPFVFNVLITLVLVVAGLYWFHSWWEPPWVTGWVGNVVEFIAGVPLALIAVGLALLAWIPLQVLLVGHFYERLAGAVERRLGVPEGELEEVPFIAGMADMARDLLLVAVPMLILVLLLPLIPVIGLIIAPPVAFYVQTLVIGREFIGFSLSMRGARWRQKRKFIARHRAHVIGVGASCLALALVPFAGAVLLVPAVTGAVILHRRLMLADEAAGWSWRDSES